jgi:hypothetical protein
MYWCSAPLPNEGERSFKDRAAGGVQAPLQQCVEDYLYDSSVGSDDEHPATRRAPMKVATPPSRRTR